MLRVAKNVFFTTPNKYFPIEAHTNIFFLHWNNAIFYNWCKTHKTWVTKDNLYLLSGNRLEKLMKLSNASSFEIHKGRLFSMVMTYTVTCRKWSDMRIDVRWIWQFATPEIYLCLRSSRFAAPRHAYLMVHCTGSWSERAFFGLTKHTSFRIFSPAAKDHFAFIFNKLFSY